MISFEWKKLLRSRRPLLAFLALALFLLLMLVGFYTYARTRTGGDADFRYTFENRSYFNGLTFTVYAFYFGFLLILPIFAATEGSTQLAGETQAGSLSLLLTRPLTKSRILLVKSGVALVYLTLLTGAFLATCLTVGLFFVGWGDLDLYPGVLAMADRHQHLEQTQALWRFALVWPAACVPLFTTLAFGLVFSSWMRSPVNAAATSVALYLVMHIVSGVHFFAELRPYLFTSSMGYWRELLHERIDVSAVLREAAKLLAFGLFFLALAHARFRRREER